MARRFQDLSWSITGDMSARWTNDRYRSTMHRVVIILGYPKAAYSVPFLLQWRGRLNHECAAAGLSGPGQKREIFRLTHCGRGT